MGMLGHSGAGNNAPRAGTAFILKQSGVAVASTNVTTEETAATITIPAGLMGAGGSIRVSVLATVTNGVSNKTIRIKFGGTAMSTLTVTTVATVRMVTDIQNRGLTNSQVSMPTGAIGTSASAVVTAAIDTTAAVSLTITTQKATGTDTCTIEGYIVEVFPAGNG